MSEPVLPGVSLRALRDALFFTDDTGGGAEAWIDRRSGAVHIVAEALDPDELALPEDLGDPRYFLPVPDSRQLFVERELALDFVAQHLPDDERLVRAMFYKKGAYRALRELLAGSGVLEAWYRHKESATEAALVAWCEEHGLRLRD